MRKLKVVALFLLYGSTAVMAKNVELSENRYQEAKSTLIKNDVMSDIVHCAKIQKGIVERYGNDKEIRTKLHLAVSRDCTNDNSFKLGLHPFEYLDFLKKLQQDGYSAAYLEKMGYTKLNARSSPEVSATSEPREVIEVKCDATCQAEFRRLEGDSGVGDYAYQLAINAGVDPYYGGGFVIFFTSTDTAERWEIPLFGNKAYFMYEVDPETAPEIPRD